MWRVDHYMFMYLTNTALELELELELSGTSVQKNEFVVLQHCDFYAMYFRLFSHNYLIKN